MLATASVIPRAPRLRVLIVTKVFPNALEPTAAAFNRQQFAALARLADVDLRAVVPWFPGAAWFAESTGAGRLHALPAFDWVDGLFVRHTRVLHVPRIDYTVAPALYVASLWPSLRRLRGGVDVVLGSFAYPDGVAAVWLARLLDVPSVVYALGSDLNVVPQIPGVSAVLRGTLPYASRVIAASRTLADKATDLGAPAARVSVIPNGVDRTLFFPADRAAARVALGQPPDGRWIVYVGRLEEAKGIGELLAAFAGLAAGAPDLRLALVGDGPWRRRCEEEATRLPGRVLLAGARPLAEVARFMSAADLVTLPSWREGTPNVLLEALASGRRVVATRVGGIPDVVSSPDYGELCPPRDPVALAAALGRGLEARYDPQAVAAGAPGSWDESAARLHATLAEAIADPAP